tara:strand:- start:394 stop:753 length:360 start_codon:yes stop_codon:yes gene_type:complete
MKKLALTATLLATLAMTGCAQRIADFTLASTKNVDLNNGQFAKGERVEGIDTKYVVLVPLGVPSVKEAADRAIETNPCAVALTDVTADSEAFAFLFGYVQYKVEGDLVIDTSRNGCNVN